MIEHSLVTLTATAQKVVSSDNMPHEVVLHNATKSSNEYIHIGGDDTITTSNSIHLDPGQTVRFTMGPDDELWALSDPSGLDLGILDIKKDD